MLVQFVLGEQTTVFDKVILLIVHLHHIFLNQSHRRVQLTLFWFSVTLTQHKQAYVTQ